MGLAILCLYVVVFIVSSLYITSLAPGSWGFWKHIVHAIDRLLVVIMPLAQPTCTSNWHPQVCAYRAGHVLGAAMFMVEVAGMRVLYTGDYSRLADRHLSAADLPDNKPHIGAQHTLFCRAAVNRCMIGCVMSHCLITSMQCGIREALISIPSLCCKLQLHAASMRWHAAISMHALEKLTGKAYAEACLPQLNSRLTLHVTLAVIVESTYGVSRHLPREEREERFCSRVRQVLGRGGRLLLPVVALGRAQVFITA